MYNRRDTGFTHQQPLSRPMPPHPMVADPWSYPGQTPVHEIASLETNAIKTGAQGSVCEVKTYEARYDKHMRRTLVAVDTVREIDPSINPNTVYALVFEQYFDHLGNLEQTSLWIKSQYILAALREVVEDYPGVNVRTNEVCLQGIPKILFHYKEELERYRNDLKDDVAKQHVELALGHMQQQLRREIKIYDNLVNTPFGVLPSIDHVNMWMVFRPGDLVYTETDGAPQVLKFKSMSLTGHKEWAFTAEYISHNGDHFGEVGACFTIPSFEGSKNVVNLQAFPLKYHDEQESIKAKLIRRGQKFCRLTGVHHRQYQGSAFTLSPKRRITLHGEQDDFPLQSAVVDGRIMVDCKTFGLVNPGNAIHLDKPLARGGHEGQGVPVGFSEEDLLICDAQVPGFALNRKKWGFFFVDKVTEFEFNKAAFDALILPPSHKSIILSLVKTKAREDSCFDDVVEGKGKGLNFILHGQPGVGKTLTAESVAEYVEQPLYVISSGELGINPTDVEKNLTTALEVATRWNAIVLIDEADVFLEQRTVHDLTRNALVSVFLRQLEYYEGILFLTSNRIKTFDYAFKSRIHVALKYPALDAASRRELWKLFLTRASAPSGKTPLDNDDLDQLALEDLNGREIKNAVRSAHALADANSGDLTLKQVQTVLDTVRSFNLDFDNLDFDGLRL